MHRIPVLSLWRPWGTYNLRHGMNVLNLSWTTHHRGDLLLAGSAHWDGTRSLEFATNAILRTGVPCRTVSGYPGHHPRGILGVVDVYDVCTTQHGCGCGPWAMPGRCHWRLRNPRPFLRPVPHHGRKRLHAVPDDTWPAVAGQLKEISCV